jgi:hypothetical protein
VDFILFKVNYPKRDKQLIIFRWFFIVSYMTISVCLSMILIEVAPNTVDWTGNTVVDALLCIIFYFYAQNIHYKAVSPLKYISSFFLIECLLFFSVSFSRIFTNRNGFSFPDRSSLFSRSDSRRY